MNNSSKPGAETMRPPTSVMVEIHTGNTAAAGAPGCCCLPASASANVQQVHCNAIAILVIHIIASIALSELLHEKGLSALYCFAVFPGIITSGIVVCGPCTSKFFYVFCAFPYLVSGIADVIICVVWYSNAHLDQDLHNVIGLVPVMAAVFTLLGAAMAFRTAYVWDNAPAVLEAPAVLATEATEAQFQPPV